MKLFAYAVLSLAIFGYVARAEDEEEAAVAVGSYKGCDVFEDEDFKVDEMDFTNLSVKYNSCATYSELDEDGNQVYTGLVTFKVKNHNDGSSTAFVTGIDNYVGIALEHAKTIRDFECDLCEMEQTENYCAHLGYAMEEEEEEEEQEQEQEQEEEQQQDEEQQQEDGGDERRFLRALEGRKLASFSSQFNSDYAFCTGCKAWCESGDDNDNKNNNNYEKNLEALEDFKDGCVQLDNYYGGESAEDNENEDQEQEEEQALYVKFYCDTNSGIKLGVYSDDTCTTTASGVSISDYQWQGQSADDCEEDEDGNVEDGCGEVSLFNLDLSVLDMSDKTYCSVSKEIKSKFPWYGGRDYVAEDAYEDAEDASEEKEEITEVCQKVFEEGSTFGCYTDINECAGTSESNVITCKYLSEIGTADSEIAMVGDEELVDSEGNTLHAWDIVRLEAQGASTGAKVWTALMVASTTALGVLACFYHGKMSSSGKSGQGLAGQGGAMA